MAMRTHDKVAILNVVEKVNIAIHNIFKCLEFLQKYISLSLARKFHRTPQKIAFNVFDFSYSDAYLTRMM